MSHWGVISLIVCVSVFSQYFTNRLRIQFVTLIPPVQNADLFVNESSCDNLLNNKEKIRHCPVSLQFSLPVSFDPDEAAKKDDQAAITRYIKDVYFARVRRKFAKESQCIAKFVFYSCDPVKIARAPGQFKACCGLGDRLRGVVASFYMALVTDTVFMFDWVHPQPLDQFFFINSEMYGINADVGNKKYDNVTCITAKRTFAYWNFVQDESGAHQFTASGGLIRELSNSSNDGVMITLNSLKTIEALLANESDTFSLIVEAYKLRHFSYTQLISAALQITFGHPQPRLQWIVDRTWNITVGRDPRSKGQTIGVQLRFNNARWSEPSRIRSNQTICFLNEVKRIIAHNKLKHPAVYVTGDNIAEIIRFVKWLKEDGVEAYRQPGHVSRHMDLGDDGRLQRSVERKWQNAADTIRDWLLLARFDYLVISRSSFAETAALFTRRTTRRFNHKFLKSCVFDDYGSISDLGMEGF